MQIEPYLVWFLIGLVLALLEFAAPGVILIFFAVGALIVCGLFFATLVVAKRDKDREAIFKEFQLKSRDKEGHAAIELKPINPDLPTLVIDRKNPGRIVGTMVEHRRYRRA